MADFKHGHIDHLEAYHFAMDLVKKAGFKLAFVSLRSESCYYYHPARGREYLLRLSTHKSKKSPLGLSGVVARQTFTEKDHYHTQTNVHQRIVMAIGLYFLTDLTPPKYQNRPKEDFDEVEAIEH